VSTIAPCIQIFHPSIDEFTCTVNDPDVQPTVKDLERVYDLMHTVSEVGPLENTLGQRIRDGLSNILDATVRKHRNPDNTKTDGVIMVDDTKIPCVFMEVKREIREGGCDPSSQASLSMRRSWIDDTVRYL